MQGHSSYFVKPMHDAYDLVILALALYNVLAVTE
jgi:hypothetical protein